MASKKNPAWPIGSQVEHKKTGRRGELLEIKDKKIRVCWDDTGLEEWVTDKQLKQVLPW